MRLGKNFYLEEFLKSQTASRIKSIDNTPTVVNIVNLAVLVNMCLQPARDHFGIPMVINSGFRSLQLNRAIGSSDNSQHIQGEAADVEMPGVSNEELFRWFKDNVPFDQLILEYYDGSNPNSGWVHISHKISGNRGEFFIINKNGQVESWSSK